MLSLVFDSPDSGTQRGTLASVFRKINDSGQFKNTYVTLKPGETDVAALVEQHKPDQLIVCGGDGSVNYVASALIGQSIPLGILPTGSANGVATDLNLPQKLPSALKSWQAGHVLEIDTIRINGGQWHCLHFADFGINAQLVHTSSENNRSGMTGYFQSFMETLSTNQKQTFTLTTDGKTHETEAVMVAVANAATLGTGAKINPSGQINDGKLGVLVFHPFNTFQMLETTVAFFRGTVNKLVNVTQLSGERITVTPHGDAPLQIDGEVIASDTDSFTFQIVPKSLRVLVPQATLAAFEK